jgi:hypothetical protein
VFIYFKNKQLAGESTPRQRLKVRVVRLKTRDLRAVQRHARGPLILSTDWSLVKRCHIDNNASWIINK